MAFFDFALIKKTAKSVADGITERRARTEELRGQLTALQHAPAARAEVKAALDAWVDEMGKGFDAGIRSEVATIAASPQSLLKPKHLASVLQLVPAATSRDDTVERRLNRALCGLFAADIKKALRDIVDSTGSSEGMSMQARAAEETRIHAELTKLNDEIEQLRCEAREAGLKIEA